jgi:heme/copper-type cytochrome/quinol oxidase subunit 2
MKKILLAISLGLWLFLNTTYAENEYLETLDNVATNRAWDEIKSSSVKDLLLSVWDNILIPIIIVLWLLLAFVGFYKLMFSDKEDERKKWVNFFLWGTAWVIMMVSAKFIANALFGEYGTSWIFGISAWQDYDPATIAANIYDKIISKFFYLAMYLVIGILFIILLINLVKFLSNPDKEEIQKNTKTIIIWNTIWILLILFSKNIIQTFYSKIESWAYTLGQQNAILEILITLNC